MRWAYRRMLRGNGSSGPSSGFGIISVPRGLPRNRRRFLPGSGWRLSRPGATGSCGDSACRCQDCRGDCDIGCGDFVSADVDVAEDRRGDCRFGCGDDRDCGCREQWRNAKGSGPAAICGWSRCRSRGQSWRMLPRRMRSRLRINPRRRMRSKNFPMPFRTTIARPLPRACVMMALMPARLRRARIFLRAGGRLAASQSVAGQIRRGDECAGIEFRGFPRPRDF